MGQESGYLTGMGRSQITPAAKIDLERYLVDPLFRTPTTSFNVLDWWRMNEALYPNLAQMARDILAVPASTVASESVSNFLRQ